MCQCTEVVAISDNSVLSIEMVPNKALEAKRSKIVHGDETAGYCSYQIHYTTEVLCINLIYLVAPVRAR